MAGVEQVAPGDVEPELEGEGAGASAEPELEGELLSSKAARSDESLESIVQEMKRDLER